MKTTPAPLVILVVALAAGCSASSTPSGSRTVELFEPTDGEDCSEAMGINNLGAVVGYSESCAENTWINTQQAFPYVADANGRQRLVVPDADTTGFGYGINDAGYIIGNGYKVATDQYFLYLYRPGERDKPETLPFPNQGDVYAVTNVRPGGAAPLVAGGAGPAAGATWQWFRYDVGAKSGTGRNLFVPPPATGFKGDGGAMAMSPGGDLAGFYTLTTAARTAMAWTEARGLLRLDDLQAPGSGRTMIMALGINDAGQVVGFGTCAGIHCAFRQDLRTGIVTDLGTLAAPNDKLGVNAKSINAKGHIVGTAGDIADTGGYHLRGRRAFFYTDALGMRDLNDLVIVPAGWELAEATAINDRDEVVGFARNGPTIRRAFRVMVDLTAVSAER